MADDSADPTNSFMVVRMKSLTDVSVNGEILLTPVWPDDVDVVVVDFAKFLAVIALYDTPARRIL